MKKKCFTPTAIKSIFVQNTTRRDIYDLALESGSNLLFSYFCISLPIPPYLIAQGAVFAAEVYKGAVKVLHTGLKRTKISSIYSGDVYVPLTRAKSLILFKLLPGANSYAVYLFDGYYPKSLNIVINEIL